MESKRYILINRHTGQLRWIADSPDRYEKYVDHVQMGQHKMDDMNKENSLIVEYDFARNNDYEILDIWNKYLFIYLPKSERLVRVIR